jgi:Tfp pilus assembly protein PilE
MDNKSAGIDYDRQVFAPSAPQPTAAPSTAGIFFFVAVIAAILALGYVGYKGFVQSSGGSTADVRALNEMQQRVNALEERLAQAEKENHRKALAAQSSQNLKNDTPIAPAQSSSHGASRPAYRISGSPAPQPSHATVTATDPATAQKLAGIQQGLGALQNDASSNREAWQATTDKLADVAGQVGVQSVQILRNQDEVNQLLVRTERVAIPFELLHGADPQLIGPVHLGLKSTNQRAQRYTLCVYVQTSCLELKDKAIYEVAQFAISRDSAPLEVIATKISKDGILGYLEIPRDKSRH